MALCFNIKSSRPNPKVKSWQFPNVHSDSRICSREITKLQYNLMWWKNNWSDPLKSAIGESTICNLENAKRPPLLGIPKNCLKSWDVSEPRKLDYQRSSYQYLQMPLPWLQSCRQKMLLLSISSQVSLALKLKVAGSQNVHSDYLISSREIAKLQYNLMWWKDDWSDPLKSVMGRKRNKVSLLL